MDLYYSIINTIKYYCRRFKYNFVFPVRTWFYKKIAQPLNLQCWENYKKRRSLKRSRIRKKFRQKYGSRFNSSKRTRHVKSILSKYQRNCGICGIPFQDGDDINIDHIIPISKIKYRHERHKISNLQLAHSRCNEIKGNKLSTDLFIK